MAGSEAVGHLEKNGKRMEVRWNPRSKEVFVGTWGIFAYNRRVGKADTRMDAMDKAEVFLRYKW